MDAELVRSPPFSWSLAVEEKAGCGLAAAGAGLGLDLGLDSAAGLVLGLRRERDEEVLVRSEKGFLLSLPLLLGLPLMPNP